MAEFILLPNERFKFGITNEDALADLVEGQTLRVVRPERIRADIHRCLAFAEPEEPEFTKTLILCLVFHSSCFSRVQLPPLRKSTKLMNTKANERMLTALQQVVGAALKGWLNENRAGVLHASRSKHVKQKAPAAEPGR